MNNQKYHELLSYSVESGNLHLSRAQAASKIYNKIKDKTKKFSTEALLILSIYQVFLNDKIVISIQKINKLLFFPTISKLEIRNLFKLSRNFTSIFNNKIPKYKYYLKYPTTYLNFSKNLEAEILKSIKKFLKPKKPAKSNTLYEKVLIKNFNKKNYLLKQKIKQKNVLAALITILTIPNFKKYNISLKTIAQVYFLDIKTLYKLLTFFYK